MGIIEPSYFPKSDVIRQKMGQKGLSINALASLAEIAPRTLSRILGDRKGRLSTFALIAPHLDVEDVSTLYVDDKSMAKVQADPDRITPDIELDEDKMTLTDAKLKNILRGILELSQAKEAVFVIKVTLKSVVLRLSFTKNDFLRLCDNFAAGNLDKLKIVGITIPRESAKPLVQLLSQRWMSTRSRELLSAMIRLDITSEPFILCVDAFASAVRLRLSENERKVLSPPKKRVFRRNKQREKEELQDLLNKAIKKVISQALTKTEIPLDPREHGDTSALIGPTTAVPKVVQDEPAKSS
jgi:transcriptional regulator with XRE-family HTH domain